MQTRIYNMEYIIVQFVHFCIKLLSLNIMHIEMIYSYGIFHYINMSHCIFWVILEFELTTPCLLRKHSTT
jgi:hypothetical protein